MPGFCLVAATASMIQTLRSSSESTGDEQNQLFHVAFLQGFSVATTAIFGQKQILMLHLFTATKMALQSTFGQALCMTF